MDYAALRAELITDPAALGYAPLGDQATADKLNDAAAGRTVARTAVPTAEVFNAIDDGAWPAVASVAESKLRTILGLPSVDASNANTRGIFGTIFPASGATSATRARLLALGTQPVSRATELGLGAVTASDVRTARAGAW